MCDILNFQQALRLGNYPNGSKRPIYFMAYEEAIDLWRTMSGYEEVRWASTGEILDPLPCPEPGRIWGEIFGVKVFVGGEPTATGEAKYLLGSALSLCWWGEKAPGGGETWHQWAKDTEAFLRRGESRA
jgi:hypothetical protein